MDGLGALREGDVRARQLGLRRAHAGRRPPEYVRAALDILGAERIDHGVRSLEDPDLVARLSREKSPPDRVPDVQRGAEGGRRPEATSIALR